VRRHAKFAIPVLALAILGFALVAGCGGGGGQGGSGAEVLRVPQDYPTVQKAVDASSKGDLVLVSPGTYQESVTVSDDHPDITIRGTDRNGVIFDGDKGKLVNGITIRADGVAVENVTVRYYAVNGVVWSPDEAYGSDKYLQGWRGSYITAYDNGLYGVYALQSQNGRFDHLYASGHPDSGIYVGQCQECAATVSDSVAEDNAVGYEDTNASGVEVSKVQMRANRIGALLDSNSKESKAPQSQVHFHDNVAEGNDNAQAPTGGQGFGAGIVISGGTTDEIDSNQVDGQPLGIVVVNANPDSGGYQATNNTITGNRLSANDTDLSLQTDGTTNGNCFSGNKPDSTFPANLEKIAVCGHSSRIQGTPPPLPVNPPKVPFLRVKPPGPQQTMPGDIAALPASAASATS